MSRDSTSTFTSAQTDAEVVSFSKPLGTLGMEQHFMVPLTKTAADWLSKSNRFHAFPPCLKNLEEEEEVYK